MSIRRALTLAVLIGWVVLGPIGMAFDACAAMMALCDGGQCGVVAAVTFAGPVLAPPQSIAAMERPSRDPLLLVVVRVLDPPPKLRLSA